jgi:hypothetical protein
LFIKYNIINLSESLVFNKELLDDNYEIENTIKGNIVIVSKNNETADKKVYIVHKLNPEQINNLIAEQKLSNTIINYYNGMHSVNIDENELININDNLNFT